MTKLVVIAKLSSPEEAISIRTLLESADIEVFGSNENYANLMNMSGIPIIVHEDDVEAARQIVVDAVKTANVSREDLKGRRLTERIKPGADIVGGFAIGFWSIPLVIASAIAAWFNSPGRKHNTNDKEPEDAP